MGNQYQALISHFSAIDLNTLIYNVIPISSCCSMPKLQRLKANHKKSDAIANKIHEVIIKRLSEAPKVPS